MNCAPKVGIHASCVYDAYSYAKDDRATCYWGRKAGN